MTIENEMNHATKENPMKAALMVKAMVEEQALKKKEQEKTHTPVFHSEGFYLTLETARGSVGLWSCWLANQLFIGYPKDWHVEDDFIAKELDVAYAKPVYHEAYVSSKLPKKPTERLWAKFYGEIVEAGGRVWIEHHDFNSNGYHFPFIQQKKLQALYYGHDESKNIHTYSFSWYSDAEPEAPSNRPAAIQPYRDKFIQLAINLAKKQAPILAVHIQYGEVVLIPEVLESLGYSDIEYVKGSPEYREGFGGTVVYAKKETEEIILKTANSLVPWVTYRKIPVENDSLTVQHIHDYLTF